MRRLLLVLTAVLLSVTACSSFLPPARAAYGQEIAFAAGRAVQYPDFALEYVGQHRVTPDVYPRGFLYYDFLVSRDGVVQDVAWTDGTGVIEPTDFVFDGVAYTLEITERNLAPLAAGRVVVKKLNE